MPHLRSSTLLALLLCAPALAQAPIQPQPVTGPTRHAGTYHVASGTWTHQVSQANLGPDVIYNASRPSGYFSGGWPEGALGVDEGILPSTGNPLAGPQDSYLIDGFEFGYCSLSIEVDWVFEFFDSYYPCDLINWPNNCQHQAGGPILVPGTPGASACWTVTVDLSGGLEVPMFADGGPCAPGYDGAATGLDHFGWTQTWTIPDGKATGPLLSGYDPQWAPPGEGTCYLPGLTCSSGATGLGAEDFWALETPGANGCYWFGGYVNKEGCASSMFNGPGAQFHLQLFTDSTVDGGTCGMPFCFTGANQLGSLSLTTCSLSASPVLVARDVTGGQAAYGLVGAGQGVISDPPGAMGDLCLGGSKIGRYVKDVGLVSGPDDSYSIDLIHGVTGGGTGALPSPLNATLAPGQTWSFQVWTRVSGSSRFTPALRVTFEA